MTFITNTSGNISSKNTNSNLNSNGYNLYSGSVVSATNTTVTFTTNASAIDDTYNNKVIEILRGPGRRNFKFITDYDGTSRTITNEKPYGEIPTSES
jgi:hypothetical protein